ncbi:MAG: cell division protein ZapA [Peptococcaceae bacterium]|nr:cell division protein ZapA [Peptococcaceae bacterium]
MTHEQTPQKIVVEIFGERHVLRGSQPEAKIQSLAANVDERMREVAQKAPFLGVHQVAILIALQLAEEEAAAREERDAMSQEGDSLSARYTAMLKEKKQMHNEIELLRQELIELQQDNAKLHSLKEILQRENNKLREDKFIWGQERDLLSDENETLSKERARLKTDLDELTSLLEAATAE